MTMAGIFMALIGVAVAITMGAARGHLPSATTTTQCANAVTTVG